MKLNAVCNTLYWLGTTAITVLKKLTCIRFGVSLCEECVCVCQDFESNELEWEHREVELERSIARLEKQQAEIASVASQVSVLDTNIESKLTGISVCTQ